MIIAMISLRETICKNFKLIMDANPELGATDIARAIDVHRSMIYKWRDGVNVPDPDHIEGLAKLFGVNVMDFYNTTGEAIVSMRPSVALKKYLVIPDRVVELASEVESTDEAWDTVISALEIARDRIESKKASSK